MKRLFGWLAGAVGGAAVYRALRRNPVVESSPVDELRAKLAETKETEPEPEPEESEVPLDPEARRAAVHEQGRAAIDELRGE